MPQSQTYPWHHEEDTQNSNSHMTARRHLKLSNQLSLPLQDDRKTKKDTNLKLPQTMGATINNESTRTELQPKKAIDNGYFLHIKPSINFFNMFAILKY